MNETNFSMVMNETDREIIKKIKELTGVKQVSSLIKLALAKYLKELEVEGND